MPVSPSSLDCPLLISHRRLLRTYFQNTPTLQLAQELIGCMLWTCDVQGVWRAVTIVETEAYVGITDQACHAFNGRRNKRNEAMYAIGGCCYVYLCYGIHPLLNVVTAVQDAPEAVLIRAGVPAEGFQEASLATTPLHRIASGPGRLTKAMGITILDNHACLETGRIAITKSDSIYIDKVVTAPRVGVEYAKEHALLPWRFYLAGCSSVSVV